MKKHIYDMQFANCSSGFFVLTPLVESKGEPIGLDRKPVVAWAFQREFTTPFPITLEGIVESDCAIQLPSGEVYVQGAGEEFETPDQWLEDSRCKWARQQVEVRSVLRGDSKLAIPVMSIIESGASAVVDPIHASLAAARVAHRGRTDGVQ